LSSVDVALTAHLVLGEAAGSPSELLRHAQKELHERFDIRHTTLQMESEDDAEACSVRAAGSCF